MRFLLILLTVACLIWAFRLLLESPKNKPKKKLEKGEKMVSCAICELHIPHSEALHADGRTFCGHSHLEQWQQQNNS